MKCISVGKQRARVSTRHGGLYLAGVKALAQLARGKAASLTGEQAPKAFITSSLFDLVSGCGTARMYRSGLNAATFLASDLRR